jgi:hypothetical protein
MRKREEPTWQDKLHEQYKHLFETYQGEGGERSYYQPGDVLRGIEVGAGWQEWVEDLLRSLDWHTTHNKHIPNPNHNPDEPPYGENSLYIDSDKDNVIQIFQIKEKFGVVTIYYGCDNPRIEQMVGETVGRFEGKCALTCEACGKLHKLGVSSVRGWLRNACPECLEAARNRK